MLRQRVLTAIVLLAVLYVATAWLPPAYFAVFLSLALVPALLEWAGLMGLVRWSAKLLWLAAFGSVLGLCFWALESGSVETARAGLMWLNVAALGFWLFVFWLIYQYPEGQARWSAEWKIGLMGIACLLPTWMGLYYLKSWAPSGVLVFTLVALVSVVDIGAYFTGRAWGRSKLAPALSPKKSWAGFWGGVACCVALAVALLAWVQAGSGRLSLSLWVLLIMATVLLAVVSVVGDLFESMLKRHRGIKDSGRILPGHGGVLDRIDSLVAATPVFVLAILLLSNVLDIL